MECDKRRERGHGARGPPVEVEAGLPGGVLVGGAQVAPAPVRLDGVLRRGKKGHVGKETLFVRSDGVYIFKL